jgi:hypothetical protein
MREHALRELSISPVLVRPRGDDPEKEDTMKYMLLINLGPEARDYENMTAEEQQAVGARWQSFNQMPGVTPGIQLQPPETATTVRVQDGRTLTTDGPFVDTKEALDGYCMLEAHDLDAAIEVASRIPAAAMGGAIEVRPIVEW